LLGDSYTDIQLIKKNRKLSEFLYGLVAAARGVLLWAKPLKMSLCKRRDEKLRLKREAVSESLNLIVIRAPKTPGSLASWIP
jgi:hypothetical protein